MIRIADLISHLNSLFSPHLFSDFCPNGLQIGLEESLVQKVAVAVTADLATINQAIEDCFDTLIVHHGIFWKGMAYPITGITYRRIQQLLTHNISLISYHLPLDAHPTIGNNWKTACDCNWEHLQPFGSGSPKLGVMGTFAPIHITDFVQQLEMYYEVPVKVQALKGPEIISSAALISGGAYKELPEAAACGVDCFITGNYDEPAWSLAEENHINFLAFGHTATEKIGPKALASYLRNTLQIPAFFLDTDNPF